MNVTNGCISDTIIDGGNPDRWSSLTRHSSRGCPSSNGQDMRQHAESWQYPVHTLHHLFNFAIGLMSTVALSGFVP